MESSKKPVSRFKNITPWIIGILFCSLFLGTGFFLYQKSQKPKEVFSTEKAFKTDIIKKSVATGSVMPRREIAIKPRVSGVLEKIYIQAGQYVKQGELLAKIKIIPNSANLNSAESSLNRAKIEFENSKKELERQEKLYKEKLISEFEYNQYVVNFNKAKEGIQAAENNLQIVREGTSKTGTSTTLVHSTVSGMVLDVPVKEGSSVIESNNFNEGTTIAIVADMNEMIFSGKVDEGEVEKIKVGMELDLTIGAIEGKKYKAKLEFISPKGINDQGTIQFEIKASIQLKPEDFLRSGYSANADIILAKKENVIAISESLLQFGKDSVYVEVEKATDLFVKKLIKTGLSDGINVEIISGITLEDKIKNIVNRGEETDKAGKEGTNPRAFSVPRKAR